MMIAKEMKGKCMHCGCMHDGLAIHLSGYQALRAEDLEILRAFIGAEQTGADGRPFMTFNAKVIDFARAPKPGGAQWTFWSVADGGRRRIFIDDPDQA